MSLLDPRTREEVDTSGWIVVAVSLLVMFLAIGSMSNSMGEAQGYLMPVMLLILLPITFLCFRKLRRSIGVMMVEGTPA